MESEYLTAFEVRNKTRLSLPYIRLLTQKKEIPHMRVGRRVLYRVDEVESWLRSKAVAVSDAAGTEAK